MKLLDGWTERDKRMVESKMDSRGNSTSYMLRDQRSGEAF